MPAHNRRVSGDNESEKNPSKQAAPKKISGKAQGIFSKINADVKAMNSSILIISQKMKYLIRNEKILGRNLLVLNKKIKALQERSMSSGATDISAIQPELDEINKKVTRNAETIARLQSEVGYLKENYAKAEEVSEIKYIIESINPLEFVSITDIDNIIEKKLSEKKKK